MQHGADELVEVSPCVSGGDVKMFAERRNDIPLSNASLQLAPDKEAGSTANPMQEAVRGNDEELSPHFPPGYIFGYGEWHGRQR